MKKIQIALVKGDGSAPEMMEQACKIAIDAGKMDDISIEFVETPMGWSAYEKYGDTFPKESFRKATELGLLFFGGVGDFKNDSTIGKERPEMKPEARALLSIRKEWGLLLNFRPVIYYKALASIAKVKINPEDIPDEGIKQIFIRFLLEDSYFGNVDLSEDIPEEIQKKIGVMLKKDVTGDESIVADIAYYNRETVERYLREAFKYAKSLGLPLISIDKANVMSRYVFWRSLCTEIEKNEFPEVELRHQLVDSANCMLFDPLSLNGVIACGNEHGDILSDGAAAAVGSMGMMCSSAVNPDNGMAMFESGAGTAPTLAGLNKANPIGRILTAALMLRHIGATKGATAIEKAVNRTLEQGYRTEDLYNKFSDDPIKKVGTSVIGNIIFRNLY